MVCYSHLFQNSPQFIVIHTVKGFGIVNKAEIDIFLELSGFFFLPFSWEISMQVKKQQLELDMEQQTGSKLGKEYVKAVYCHPAYLTSMQSTSWETLDCMKHKLESRLPGDILLTSDIQMTPPL